MFARLVLDSDRRELLLLFLAAFKQSASSATKKAIFCGKTHSHTPTALQASCDATHKGSVSQKRAGLAWWASLGKFSMQHCPSFKQSRSSVQPTKLICCGSTHSHTPTALQASCNDTHKAKQGRARDPQPGKNGPCSADFSRQIFDAFLSNLLFSSRQGFQHHSHSVFLRKPGSTGSLVVCVMQTFHIAHPKRASNEGEAQSCRVCSTGSRF